ncbi:MAG TPA: hypothetical protein VFW73_05530 [Lacipirellulaceae bacterium]|nr:hypothetical protein [Lacipirellulaceae bacterium]
MGEIIQFPGDAGASRGGGHAAANPEPASVIILPVVRIERNPDGSSVDPRPGNNAGRGRRRRMAR